MGSVPTLFLPGRWVDIYTDGTAPSRGLSAICDDQVGYAKGSIEPDLLLVRVLSGIGYGGLNHYDHNRPMGSGIPVSICRVRLAGLRCCLLIHSRPDYS